MEEKILLWIQNNLRCEFLDIFFKTVTHLGDAGIFWILLTLVMLLIKKQRKTGLMCTSALIFDLVSVNMIIKKLAARVRPYENIPELSILIERQSDFSFPSGHTAASFAVVSVLLMRTPKKFSIPMTVLAFLISFSRLYVGVHYPTDVIFGMVIGIICGVCGVFFVEFIYKKKKNKTKHAADEKQQ